MIDDVITTCILVFFGGWLSFLASRATKRVHTIPVPVFLSRSWQKF